MSRSASWMSDPEALKELCEQVVAGDTKAEAKLYEICLDVKGLLYFKGILGDEQLDLAHETYVVLLTNLRRRKIKDVTRIRAFARTVIRRMAANRIAEIIHSRNVLSSLDEDPDADRIADQVLDPEQRMALRSRRLLVRQGMAELLPRQRDILMRFYVHDQTAEQIQAEMGLTPTKFRLLKHRSKARLTQIVELKLHPKLNTSPARPIKRAA